MRLAAILLAALLTTTPHWVKDKDSYHVHQVYLGTYGDVIGEYYQIRANDSFIAACEWKGPVDVGNEALAKQYIETKCSQ